MKRILLPGLLFLAWPVYLFTQNFPLMNDLSKMEKEVLKTVKDWNDAFSRNDPEKYFSYIHDDLTLFIPASPYRIDGKADDREEFEYSLAKGWTKVGYFQELQPKVQLFGEVAIVTYYTRGTYGKDESEKVVFLKETNVLARVDGRWEIAHIHVSK